MSLTSHFGRPPRCDGRRQCTECANNGSACIYTDTRLSDSDETAMDDTQYIQTILDRLKRAQTYLDKETQTQGKDLGLWYAFPRAVELLLVPLAPPHREDTDAGLSELSMSLSALSLDTADPGYQGRSGNALLTKAAAEARSKSVPPEPERSPPASKPWTLRMWETPSTLLTHALDLPAPALLGTLIQLYFTRTHTVLPLLHRQTFDAHLSSELHTTHIGFAKTLLLVGALGATYLPAPYYAQDVRFGLAWKLYRQFLHLNNGFPRQQASVYDVQSYCLAASFMDCMDNARTALKIADMGIRVSFDTGGHRAKVYSPDLLDAELENRAFWMLLFLDVNCCATIGRPVMLDLLDMDTGVAKDFPDSIPGYMHALTGLYRIMSFMQRVVYALNRVNIMTGIQDPRRMIQPLDRALDVWMASLAAPLRWNPSPKPDPHLPLDQSATLHCMYYYIRILVHRRYLPSVAQSSGTPPDTESIAICSTAARECIRVALRHSQIRPDTPIWLSQSPLFTSAMVLVLCARDHDGDDSLPDSVIDVEGDLRLAEHAERLLRTQAERWPSSQFFADTLHQVLNMEDPADPNVNANPTQQSFTGYSYGSPESASTSSPENYTDPETPPQMDVSDPDMESDVLEGATVNPGQINLPPAFVGDAEIVLTKGRRARVIASGASGVDEMTALF
uniref:Xylanolytic transcriptional activator regulatory domain-containing protein n=1 Tax=Mycena chlorophos TaxID=658473 RepID=A0ABQ0LNJ1_MYCCL|nr:predicted protein [Mycena chlorophos]